MTVHLIDFFGDRDGIRWGHASSPQAPTMSGHFMWTYDALGDIARVFRAPVGEDMVASEFRRPRLAAAVRALVRERMGLPT